MIIDRSAKIIFTTALVLLYPLLARSEATSKKPVVTPKDGKHYLAQETGHAIGGALLVFRKQGAEIVGISYTPYWQACYHGSLDGNVIHVKEAVFQHTDPQTKEILYEPVFESVRDRFVDIQFYGLQPYPNPKAIIPAASFVVARDVKSLNECANHFSIAGETGPPCDDPNLRATMQTDDTMKYFHTSIACRESESSNCSIEKVFDAMIATPSAIAPVSDNGEPQIVKDCGILVLKSFTAGILGHNKIKTKIDVKNHTVTNYTMKGHVFYPGRVTRYLVEVDGRIDINTVGLGAESKWKTLINIGAGKVPYFSVWDTADNALRSALLTRLDVPITKQ